MKKIIYYILFISIFLMQSCLKEEENLFDASSADRMTGALKEYTDVLESAPNGWLMRYYPGNSSNQRGGYNYIVSFKDGQVTAACELAIKTHTPGDKVTSLYKMISDRGPVLTFDTYNDLLHFFSTPTQTSPSAMYGDYEFMMTEVSKDKIVMTSKKYKNTIVMTPMAAGKDWKEYMDEIITISQKIQLAPAFYLVVDGKEIRLRQDLPKRMFSATYQDGGETKNVNIRYMYTAEGIRFYQPENILKFDIQNFKYVAPAAGEKYGKLTCTDNNATNVTILFKDLLLNEKLAVGQWIFDRTMISPALQKVWDNAAEAIADDYGFSLEFGYIGASHLTSYPGTSMVFLVSPYWGSYLLNFAPDPNSIDHISFSYKSDGANGAPFAPYLKPYYSKVCDNSPYKIEADDIENPTVMQLTSKKDPTIWFVVQLD